MKGFVKISKFAGMREDLVQAGGGNSSYKITPDKMAIKASGHQLADVTEKSGYALVDPRIIKESFLKCEDLDGLTDTDGKRILEEAFIEGNRPSIETFLHAISGCYTLHTHPMVVNVLTCRRGGMDVLKELFPEALFVEYATPGIELAKTYFKAYKNRIADRLVDFHIVFLQNHGLVISADTANGVIEKTEIVTKTIEKYIGADLSSYHDITRLWKYYSDKIVWKVTDENVLNVYRKNGAWNHAFCPDCVVFLGKRFLKLPSGFTEAGIKRFYDCYGVPAIIDYNGTLYIVADSVKKALETQSVLSFSAQVMALNDGYDCNLLSEPEQNFLLDWDAEKYRKAIK